MKKLILVLFVAILALPANSQLLKFGIKAGAESAWTPKYDLSTGGNSLTIDALKSSNWGWNAGIFLRIKLLGIYVQPEVIFGSTSFKYNVDSTNYTGTKLLSQQFNKVTVPVLIGFKLGPLRVNAGPAATMQLGNPKALLSASTYNDMYKGATWGYQVGLGLDLLKKLTIDARYAGGFGNQFGSAINVGGQTLKLNNSAKSIFISVGYMF
ncbi:MAG TPA: outer membrane beta-barrel protein [Bacteroidales bacterium]|nr:outer membrane beta-barrel protein [Bacteroidales bacterium]